MHIKNLTYRFKKKIKTIVRTIFIMWMASDYIINVRMDSPSNVEIVTS